MLGLTKPVDDDGDKGGGDPLAEQARLAGAPTLEELLAAKQRQSEQAAADDAKAKLAAPTQADAEPQKPAPVAPAAPVAGTAVAVVAANGLQVIDYGEDADAGYENIGKEDISVPFLLILHPQSPTMLDGKEGHKLGLLMNNVTQEVYDTLDFVPAATTHVFNEWKPNQGGYVGTHAQESELVKAAVASQAFGEYKTPEGNDLIETCYVHGIAIDRKTGVEMAMTIPFKSTGIKVYKNWITNARTQLYQMADGHKAVMPLMSHVFKLTTMKKTNGQNVYFILVVTWAFENAKKSTLLANDPLFQAAVGVNKVVRSGKVKTDYAATGGSDGNAEAKGDRKVNEKDIPF